MNKRTPRSPKARFSFMISTMSKCKPNSLSNPANRILGDKAYAAIAAVEGLYLSEASKKRLAALRASGLTPDEPRAAVLRAYGSPKGGR